jgi:simple sugar transport system permease protein
MNKQKNSLLRNDGFQSLISSLICVLGGLIVGFIVLLIIEPSGAFDAIMAVMKSFSVTPAN